MERRPGRAAGRLRLTTKASGWIFTAPRWRNCAPEISFIPAPARARTSSRRRARRTRTTMTSRFIPAPAATKYRAIADQSANRKFSPGVFAFPMAKRFHSRMEISANKDLWPEKILAILWSGGSDDVPAYQLACVVDDAAMQITEVVRGADLLLSTARQILLYRALGLPPPDFFHCDLMLDEHGERLAKRHDALSLRTLREPGVSPGELRRAGRREIRFARIKFQKSACEKFHDKALFYSLARNCFIRLNLCR